jgi:hypothetical protein
MGLWPRNSGCDISSTFENQLVPELGYQKFMSGSSRVIPMVAAGIVFIAEQMGVQC